MIQQCFVVSPKVKDAREDFGALYCSKMLNTLPEYVIATKNHGLKQGSSASLHFSAWLHWDQRQQTFPFPFSFSIFPPPFLAKLTLKSSL